MDKSTTSASQQPLSSSLPEDEQPEITIAAPSTSTSKKQAPSTKKPFGLPTRERFTKQDMEFILTWMEHRPNFESVFGCGGQTVIGAPNKSKTHGYSVLAQGVTKQSKGRLNINGKAMRERFQRHMKAYTEAKRKAESTGFGVTEDDTRKGLYTVAHKLEIEDDEEEEEEDGNEEEEEGEEEEEERDGIHAEGGVIDNIFGEDFDDPYDASADNQGNSTRDTRGHDGDSVNDGTDVNAADDISELSISSPPVFRRQSKRQLTDTESQSSNKRSRATDRRKKPPTLDPNSSPEMPRRSFLASYEQSYMKRNTEAKKLELEERKQDMEAERLELDKAKEAKRQDMDERRLKLEEKRLEKEIQREMLQMISAGLAKGMSSSLSTTVPSPSLL
ncbi:hypothetical protein BGZ91_007729 [Linnemannia elongata]|nr:hypothetical protein BGZ91_007729 [Linnemannia elongata]KAG0048347.1 hypothetical protein BGZ90_007661 [Linnemannia elongata]